MAQTAKLLVDCFGFEVRIESSEKKHKHKQEVRVLTRKVLFKFTKEELATRAKMDVRSRPLSHNFLHIELNSSQKTVMAYMINHNHPENQQKNPRVGLLPQSPFISGNVKPSERPNGFYSFFFWCSYLQVFGISSTGDNLRDFLEVNIEDVKVEDVEAKLSKEELLEQLKEYENEEKTLTS